MRVTRALPAGGWQLRGWRQNDWELARTVERAKVSVPDVGPLPATVPGSVRAALLAAGEIPDPLVGRASRASEWIENRHWSFSTNLPKELADDLESRPGSRAVLVCDGLDYAGRVLIGELEIGSFAGSFTRHEFDVTEALAIEGGVLSIVFTEVPDGLGQNGWTSRIRAWKPRFNYGWDWTPRLVQIGITEPPRIEVRDDAILGPVSLRATYDWRAGSGSISLGATAAVAGHELEVAVVGPGVSIVHRVPARGVQETFDLGVVHAWRVLPAETQALYSVRVRLLSPQGFAEDTYETHVGFRALEWCAAEGSPAGAEPWLCVVNGEPLFLQGVNWVPMRTDYADVTATDYRDRLEAYREMGVNMLRVWGGAGLETETFYRICDELGILIWQELPLSSSGLDNAPPADAEFAAELASIAVHYAESRGHHASLALWGGGNELTEVTAPAVPGSPLDESHPALAAAGAAFRHADPGRRYVPTSPIGPRFEADEREFGRGLHHDVHGPWEHDGDRASWERYWDADDAILRSEVGVAGASNPALLAAYGLLDEDATVEGLRRTWTHSSGWWLADFERWAGRTPLLEWIEDSQARQAEMLEYAAHATKSRFPRSTGFLVWMGHDAFPCAVSLALIDYRGELKPAARALAAVFRAPIEPGFDSTERGSA